MKESEETIEIFAVSMVEFALKCLRDMPPKTHGGVALSMYFPYQFGETGIADLQPRIEELTDPIRFLLVSVYYAISEDAWAIQFVFPNSFHDDYAKLFPADEAVDAYLARIIPGYQPAHIEEIHYGPDTAE